MEIHYRCMTPFVLPSGILPIPRVKDLGVAVSTRFNERLNLFSFPN